jgi:RNA polymerase sigma factor (sigma-70 family)
MSRRVRSGADDRRRFEQLYADTRTSLLAYLVRRAETAEEAADLLGEVYLVAWRHIGQVPAGGQARLWLFGVARRLLANHRRRLRSQSELATALESVLRLEGERRSQEARSLDPALAAALAALKPGDRELILLTAWEELTPAEIAAVVGQPSAVVRVRLHRVRMKLQARLASGGHGPARNRPAAVNAASAD